VLLIQGSLAIAMRIQGSPLKQPAARCPITHRSNSRVENPSGGALDSGRGAQLDSLADRRSLQTGNRVRRHESGGVPRALGRAEIHIKVKQNGAFERSKIVVGLNFRHNSYNFGRALSLAGS